MSQRFRDDSTAGRPRSPATEALLRRRRALRVATVVAFLVVVAAFMTYSAATDDPRPDKGGGGQKVEMPCPQVRAPDASPPTFDDPPDLTLEEGVDYSAVIETSCGPIEIDLLEDVAPQNVANFVFLSEQGFYDGLTWPRIERDFVIQTGDPDGIIGNDLDGPGYTIPDERPRSPREYTYGAVAMANDGPGTAGSQFFIVVHDPEQRSEPAGLEAEYSIFGQVEEPSFETLEKIATMPVRGGDDLYTAVQPRSPIVIESVEIRTAS